VEAEAKLIGGKYPAYPQAPLKTPVYLFPYLGSIYDTEVLPACATPNQVAFFHHPIGTTFQYTSEPKARQYTNLEAPHRIPDGQMFILLGFTLQTFGKVPDHKIKEVLFKGAFSFEVIRDEVPVVRHQTFLGEITSRRKETMNEFRDHEHEKLLAMAGDVKVKITQLLSQKHSAPLPFNCGTTVLMINPQDQINISVEWPGSAPDLPSDLYIRVILHGVRYVARAAGPKGEV
jgi:hypothetical protein